MDAILVFPQEEYWGGIGNVLETHEKKEWSMHDIGSVKTALRHTPLSVPFANFTPNLSPSWKNKMVAVTHKGIQDKLLSRISNEAAIAIQCKLNIKLIAALLFIPYSIVLIEEIANFSAYH